jgi:hypothetical protein
MTHLLFIASTFRINETIDLLRTGAATTRPVSNRARRTLILSIILTEAAMPDPPPASWAPKKSPCRPAKTALPPPRAIAAEV